MDYWYWKPKKNTFLKNFWILFQERKKTAFDLRNFALAIKKEVWVSGRNRYSAKVLDLLGLEGSNPSASARFGSLAQLDQSTTLRTSGSGVRVSHESQTMEPWQTWCMRRTENPENVVRIHEAPLLHSGVLQWQRGWTVTPLSNDFVGSSPTSRTK